MLHVFWGIYITMTMGCLLCAHNLCGDHNDSEVEPVTCRECLPGCPPDCSNFTIRNERNYLSCREYCCNDRIRTIMIILLF